LESRYPRKNCRYPGGSLSYIERPEQALIEFTRLFNRLQSVRLTNAFLQLELDARTHLADLKPIAQVAPETIEIAYKKRAIFTSPVWVI